MGIILSSYDHIEKSICDVWAEEAKPIWIPQTVKDSRPSTSPATFPSQNRNTTNTRRVSRRESRLESPEAFTEAFRSEGVSRRVSRRLSSRESRPVPQVPLRRTNVSGSRLASSVVQSTLNNRLTLGYNRESQMVSDGVMTSRDELLRSAMARRTKRAYQLAEQTCRLTALMPQNGTFLSDESDEEGFVRPKPKPIYFRHTTKPDYKTLSEMSEKEYPGSYVKTASILNAPTPGRFSTPLDLKAPDSKKKVHKYMKQQIVKNGIALKRPTTRPKHLLDCLRDPVHYEFFHRFAKYFNFDRSVKFWRAVQNIKDETVSNRKNKIKNVADKFFSKGAATGIGLDAQVLREISSLPPDKVTISMLISAQAHVLKSLEDSWGETYLSSFVEKKCCPEQYSTRENNEMTFDSYLRPGKMAHAWRAFYSFIKRSAKFIRCMKNMELRMEFERYLESVGRDPKVYKSEGWNEVTASSIDNNMNEELMYHQNEMSGRKVIAEFLIYDFRFWCDVECYRKQAEAVHRNRRLKEHSVHIDEQNLIRKANQICDHFLKSSVLPVCRVNIKAEICGTILENVKLGMIDVSLFHDCVISIFPPIVIYWKKFCERRHQYVPRADVQKLKNELIIKRRENFIKPTSKHYKSVKSGKKCVKSGKVMNNKGDSNDDDPLVTARLSASYSNITKAAEKDKQIISFSLCNGLKLAIPPNDPPVANIRLR